MLKKCLAAILSMSLAIGAICSSAVFVNATTPTEITPFPYTHEYGQAVKVMFPGNVFWGDMIRVKGWGIPVEDPNSDEAVNSGYRDSQHRISQFMSPDFVIGQSDPMSSIRYTPLDVKLFDGESALSDPNYQPYDGLYKADDPNFYRERKMYGTFLGVRQDYAVFPAVPSRGLKEMFMVKPGSYVATSLLFNSYTLNYSGGAYATMDQGWQFLSSTDGENWEPLTPEFHWENGTKGTPIIDRDACCFYSVTASMKIPDGHLYYAVVSPADSGLEGARPIDTFAIGATKVSSTSMANGAYGDEYADVYGASSKQDDAIVFDYLKSEINIFADFDVKLDQVLPLIDGNVKFFKADGTTELLETESMSLAKTMGCYTKAGEKKLEYAVNVKPTGQTTIGPNDTKKTLYPGVVDRLAVSYNYGVDDKIYYNDYAEISGDVMMVRFDIEDEFMGKNIPFVYFSAQGLGENDTIKYSILPSTYVATGLVLHPAGMYKEGTTVMDEAKAKAIGKSLIYETSSDGITWTEVEMNDDNFHLENTTDGAEHSSYVILKASFKAPDDAYYYRINMQFTEVPGVYYLLVGPTKTSKTDMSGDKTGDAEVDWYELPEVKSNNSKLNINRANNTITISSIEDVSLEDVVSMLDITKITYQFKNADDSEITDLSTILASQMKVLFTIADSDEVYGEYVLIFEKLEPEKEPGIESKDDSVVTIDETTKKIIVKKENLTLEDLMGYLKLNGGVEIIFCDASEEMINDLSTKVETNQTLEVYSDILLSVYTIEVSVDKSDNSIPSTSEMIPVSLIFVLPILMVAVLVVSRKKN